MDTVISAVISDFISRFISFVVENYQAHHQVIATHKISRLQRLLLRASIVVEEAGQRQIINHGMLLQLKQLRESLYRGYYMLDTSDVWPSRSNGLLEVSQHKLQVVQIESNLEAKLEDMKEFLLLLMNCPPISRQPYSTYLFMERCMFGRQLEKEHIVNFLLSPCSSLDILPVIGPIYVGKNTLVEHACREEIVQRNFSNILHFSSDDLVDLANGTGTDNHKKFNPSTGRSVIVAELVHDSDVVAWRKLYRSLHRGVIDSSKVILISRMDCASSLGTVEALRLTKLHEEEHWYFFRVLAFGSANPYDHHPDLASVAKEIAMGVSCSLMTTRTVARVLRGNLNVQFWRRALNCIRKAIQMHIHVFGEDPKETQSSSNRFLSYFQGFSKDSPLMFCYNRYRTRSSMVEGDMTNKKRAEDALTARPMQNGEMFDIAGQSDIPPYHNYVSCWVVEKNRRVDLRNKCLKRKRN